MGTSLEEYKALIDALVALRPDVLVRWVKEMGWPALSENEKYNQLLAELTPAQKEIVADIVQQGRDGGIHDVLVYLHDEIALHGLRLYREAIPIAFEPYGTEMYFDWVARLDGMPWPEHQLADEYLSQEAGENK